ncbi:hypothetical protein A2U01_0090603, partial [Trifolium medium]|nr:hypothetical protein [Trifolium medium]
PEAKLLAPGAKVRRRVLEVEELWFRLGRNLAPGPKYRA